MIEQNAEGVASVIRRWSTLPISRKLASLIGNHSPKRDSLTRTRKRLCVVVLTQWRFREACLASDVGDLGYYYRSDPGLFYTYIHSNMSWSSSNFLCQALCLLSNLSGPFIVQLPWGHEITAEPVLSPSTLVVNCYNASLGVRPDALSSARLQPEQWYTKMSGSWWLPTKRWETFRFRRISHPTCNYCRVLVFIEHKVNSTAPFWSRSIVRWILATWKPTPIDA